MRITHDEDARPRTCHRVNNLREHVVDNTNFEVLCGTYMACISCLGSAVDDPASGREFAQKDCPDFADTARWARHILWHPTGLKAKDLGNRLRGLSTRLS